jgi:hypothetical protein
MKTTIFLTLFTLAQIAAHADFSYTSTRKTTGGAMAAMAGGANGTSKMYFKGRKMKTEDGDSATILDFSANTITIVNNTAKTVTVRSLADPSAQASAVSVDVKETGQHKIINGLDAKEVVLTMETDLSQGRGMGGKAQVEADLWIASGVPGANEMRDFYQANASRLPGSGVQATIGEIQKKIASMNGFPIQEIIKVKQAGGTAAPQMPQMTSAQSAQMDQARARLEAMKAQGGPAAAMAEQALARMGPAGGAAPAGAASGSLIEMTIDSSDFSAAGIPDSVFAIPSDYRKIDAK